MAEDPAIAASAGLRRNYLTGFDLIFQSIGTVAPSACLALLLPVIFAASGVETWACMLFAGCGVTLLATQMNVFGRRIASPGALYAFVHASLGPIAGILAGWSSLFAYTLFVATIPPQVANLISGLLHERFGIDFGTPAILGLMIAAVIVPWWLAQQDVQLSARVTSVVEIATMMLVLFLIVMACHHGGTIVDPDQASVTHFTFAPFHAGLILAFLCFGGFESSMELGAEAKRPFVTIPRTLLIIVALLTLFFVGGSYGEIAAFHGITPGLDKQDSPLVTLANNLGIGTAGMLVSAGILCSLMASLLGCINTSSRILYAFAHRGLAPRAIRQTHDRHATPHRAIAAVTLIGLAIDLALSACGFTTLEQLDYIGTVSSLSILVSYAMVALAAPIYARKQGALTPWRVISAVLTICFLAVPLVGSLYPVPDYPHNLLPYFYLAPTVLALGYFLWVRRIDPARLEGFESELMRVETVTKTMSS